MQREQLIFSMKTLELLPPPETMFRALVNRDPSFEGIFTLASHDWNFLPAHMQCKKTGTRNVDFFARANEALESGYRPCLRCHQSIKCASAEN